MAGELEDVLARRTESLDAAGISLLVKRSTDAVFGRTNVENTIERANLAISLAVAGTGDPHSVIGHISLFDYPNSAASSDPAVWEEWLHTHYHCLKASPMNTLFLHLFVAKDGFQKSACEELLRNAFMAVPLLQYVFLCVPEGASLDAALQEHFSPVEGREDPPPPAAQLYVTQRHQHFPMLHIRPARVEDADDLTPILRQYSGDINQQYGEHFLAELIESQDDKHKTIVAEVGGLAIGFMSLTTVVDVELLNACYQLEPYHGLRHPDQADDLQSIYTEETPQSGVTLLSSSGNSAALSPTQEQPGTAAAVSALLAPSATSTAPKSQTSSSTITSSSHQLQNKSVKSVASQQSQSQQSQVLKQASAQGLAAGSQITTSGVKPGQSQQKMTATQSAVAKASATSMASQASTSTGVAKTSPAKTTPQPPPSVPDEQVPVGGGGSKKAPRKQRCVPSGACSALAIQLFAVDEQYEMRSIDFLPSVFQLFPEHNFCVLTQPHSMPEFPLLSHFTRVNPRVGATISQELYVFHKCALLHSFSVGMVAPPDLPAVEGLVKGLDGTNDVIKDVQRFIDAGRDPLDDGATPMFAAVAKCAGQVVGVAVLRQEEDIGYLRSHFNIEDFVYFSYHSPSEHGHLHHLVLSPVFAPHTKHFLRELLRLSGKTCLYYPLSLDAPSKPHTISTALAHLVPIRARRQVCYAEDGLGINAPLKGILEQRPPFALYHTNRKLTLEPKITVNARVVVVGASDTATALLESLVFSPHLHLSNLSLVSPHTLTDHPGKEGEAGGTCLPQSCCYKPAQLPLLGLKHWVNTVRGTMVAIDRSEQCITVETPDKAGDALIHYDKLIICAGTQFCCPQLSNSTPPQVWTINDSHQSSHFVHWLKTKLIPGEGNLIVYGSSLNAFCTLHAAVSQGLPPERIILVLPRPPVCFNNPAVEQRVHEAVQSLGVAVYSDLMLEGWKEEGESVRVVSGDGERRETIHCKALVCLEDKEVDKKAFKAVNDACLVFDGRLVISTQQCTNDPHILAAGPFTKFSRKYRADQWTHANFNSKEVGYKLASALLQELDPTAQPCDADESESDLLPQFKQPKAVFATLPGGLHYLHVEKPNLGESLESLMQQEDYGQELLTDTERGYFRLHVNQYSKIQTITVLSPNEFPVDNYLSLYDMHEKYLNNLVGRYNDKLIADLFSYFEEPWACAVFHDRFPDFMEEIREHLASQPIKEGSSETLRDKVCKGVEENPRLPFDHAKLAAEFENSPVKELLEKRLFRFLHYNSYHLPMYAKPDLLS